MDWKPIIVVCALTLMWGCASRGVRCDGRLQPINAPAPAAETTAEPAKPSVDAQGRNAPETQDD